MVSSGHCVAGLQRRLHSYGLYSYGKYSCGLYSYGKYSCGHWRSLFRCSVGATLLHSPTAVLLYRGRSAVNSLVVSSYSYGLHGYGPYSYGLYSYGLFPMLVTATSLAAILYKTACCYCGAAFFIAAGVLL